MSELDTLTEQFERLLEGIRGKHSLDEWRHAYRKVIYSGAMKILEDFPEIIIGPVHPVAAERPPYRPNAIGQIVCIALDNCPPPHTQS